MYRDNKKLLLLRERSEKLQETLKFFLSNSGKPLKDITFDYIGKFFRIKKIFFKEYKQKAGRILARKGGH